MLFSREKVIYRVLEKFTNVYNHTISDNFWIFSNV